MHFINRLYSFYQEARQEVMNRGMELSEVQDAIREAESAAKVCEYIK